MGLLGRGQFLGLPVLAMQEALVGLLGSGVLWPLRLTAGWFLMSCSQQQAATHQRQHCCCQLGLPSEQQGLCTGLWQVLGTLPRFVEVTRLDTSSLCVTEHMLSLQIDLLNNGLSRLKAQANRGQ